ncbi:MAG: NADH-quinone oxidoreductase subunit NuoH [Actinobacteria bacterium]|nr:MAG: NADH-quinone oxidoreductase subunit NuoH [Actinomycetota bacterium]
MNPFLAMLLSALAALVAMLGNVLVLIWYEQKVLAHIQIRMGPMRTGFHGMAQPLADALKVMTKEDIQPAKVDKWLFNLAPIVVFVPAYLLYLAVPATSQLVGHNFDLSLFYVFAVAALFPIGILMAGWSSNNKYSLLGGLRAAAQQISYEVPMLLSVLGVVMLSGTLSIVEIVEAQARAPYVLYQPVAFLLFLTTLCAELNRTPFDMPEAESELVAGYQTEYSGMKFALFMLAEYANLFVLSALAAALFLGGWNGPVLPPVVWFFVKTYFIITLIIWIRGSLPRVRVDQLMDLGWKILLPLGLLNILYTGVLIMLPGVSLYLALVSLALVGAWALLPRLRPARQEAVEPGLQGEG